MDDYWDSNWLQVTASMATPGSHVEATGPFLRNVEILGFLEELRSLHQSLRGKAELTPLEQELHLSLEGNGRGHIAIKLELSPDRLNQEHSFEFATDQTYLAAVISSCEAILEAYPVRGSPEG